MNKKSDLRVKQENCLLDRYLYRTHADAEAGIQQALALVRQVSREHAAVEVLVKVALTEMTDEHLNELVTLTQERRGVYLKHNGRGCPFCGPDAQAEGDSYDSEKDLILQEYRCLDCGSCWHNHYVLKDLSSR